MRTPQSGILSPIPSHARYLSFALTNPAAARTSLRALQDAPQVDGERVVVGIGAHLCKALHSTVAGLTHFPQMPTELVGLPDPEVLWLWLRGDDRGELLHHSRDLTRLLSPAFHVSSVVDAFKHKEGHDLTGFEDGTENPQGDDAVMAAFVNEGETDLRASSFVAVQRWVHDFERFDALSVESQDFAIGRRRHDNEELDEAPLSAHVKRTAQESFTPEAFVLRRSMPWIEGQLGGLMFVAFGKSFAAFEAQFTRMTGREDGIVDALFSFTHPQSSAYYWCPPMRQGKLDLSSLGY